MVERHGLIVNVRPERREEYLRLHAAVWPGVEATITAANITNYSIFIAGDTLIAHYEYVGDDHASQETRNHLTAVLPAYRFGTSARE